MGAKVTVEGRVTLSIHRKQLQDMICLRGSPRSTEDDPGGRGVKDGKDGRWEAETHSRECLLVCLLCEAESSFPALKSRLRKVSVTIFRNENRTERSRKMDSPSYRAGVMLVEQSMAMHTMLLKMHPLLRSRTHDHGCPIPKATHYLL